MNFRVITTILINSRGEITKFGHLMLQLVVRLISTHLTIVILPRPHLIKWVKSLDCNFLQQGKGGIMVSEIAQKFEMLQFKNLLSEKEGLAPGSRILLFPSITKTVFLDFHFCQLEHKRASVDNH